MTLKKETKIRFRKIRAVKLRLIVLLIGSIMVLSGCWIGYFFTGFASGTKAIKGYYFEGYSKSELNSAIKRFVKNNPDNFMKPVDSLANFFEHYSFKAGSTDPYIRALNADSVCFHFKIKYNDSTIVLFWTQVSGLTKYWERKISPYGVHTELAIIGISDDFSSWKGDTVRPKPTRKDKRKMRAYRKEFENRIILKIREELKVERER